MSPPSSWTPEYAQENSSAPLLNVCISFAIIETFFIISLIASWHLNNHTKPNWRPVLYFIALGYVFCIGGVALGILQITSGGAGYHAVTLAPNTLTIMFKLAKAHEFVYLSSILFPKLAILYLYLQLFVSKTMRYIIYATTSLVIGTYLFGIVASAANCRPFSAYWNHAIEERCTMDRTAFSQFYSIPNLVSDALLLLILLPAIRKVQVGMSSKVELYLTFLVIALGLAAAVLRFVCFLQSGIYKDITYLGISTMCWTIIEPGVYFVASTIPMLRHLIRRIFRRKNGLSPTPTQMSSQLRTSAQLADENGVINAPSPVHKKSPKSPHWDFVETIGQLPTRRTKKDDRGYVRGPTAMSVRSADEESLVCADARTHETFARQGRNPDGTLSAWSLQPVEISPLRTSFFYANN